MPPTASPLELGNAKLRWEARSGGAGKGDVPRAVRGDSYRRNYRRIFRKREQ